VTFLEGISVIIL